MFAGGSFFWAPAAFMVNRPGLQREGVSVVEKSEVDRRLIRIASDPIRLQALTLLNERSAGASELAAALEVSLSTIGRHLDAMREAGLIEVVGEVLTKGEVEPRYRALIRALWNEEEWAAFNEEEQKRLTGWIVEMISADAREAIDKGTYNRRLDAHASRTTPVVDEQGWQELCRILNDALNAVFAVEAASAERLAENGESGFRALTALLCCEMPPLEGETAS
jgi:DNA-binding transcriptional ArsR family regulator